jgi:hypothetical protein
MQYKWIKFERKKCAAAGNRTQGLLCVSFPFDRLSYPTPNFYCPIFRCSVIKYIACLRTAAHVQIEISPVHPVNFAYNYSAWTSGSTQSNEQHGKHIFKTSDISGTISIVETFNCVHVASAEVEWGVMQPAEIKDKIQKKLLINTCISFRNCNYLWNRLEIP